MENKLLVNIRTDSYYNDETTKHTIEKIVENKRLIELKSKKAFERAMKEFTSIKNTKKLYQVYTKLLV